MAVVLSSAHAEENLLQNPALNGTGKNPAHWDFSIWNVKQTPGLADLVDWGLTDVDGQRVLFISSKPGAKANLWWQQRMDVTGSGNYRLSVHAKAEAREESAVGAISVGIYFLDANSKWLAYKQLPASQKLSGDWQLIEGNILAPEESARLVVRIGVDFKGSVMAYFNEPVLQSVAQ